MSTDEKTLALLHRFKNGDELAFEQLNEKYRAVVESATMSVVKSMERSGISVGGESQEDLKQEATLALYRAAMKYDPDGNGKAVTFGLYAKICVRNALISEFRRVGAAKRRADRAERRLQIQQERPSRDNTLGVLSQIRLQELLKESRRILSRYEQNVLSEYVTGRSVSDIARELNKSQKSVNNALYRIRTKLRNLAQEPDAKF